MWQSERPHLIQGTLLDQRKVLHDVELVIVTKPKSGRKGTKEETISKMKFAQQSPVPDGGPYILQYVLNSEKHRDPVRIKSGKLAVG
jgi:hypothetical protein